MRKLLLLALVFCVFWGVAHAAPAEYAGWNPAIDGLSIDSLTPTLDDYLLQVPAHSSDTWQVFSSPYGPIEPLPAVFDKSLSPAVPYRYQALSRICVPSHPWRYS